MVAPLLVAAGGIVLEGVTVTAPAWMPEATVLATGVVLGAAVTKFVPADDSAGSAGTLRFSEGSFANNTVICRAASADSPPPAPKPPLPEPEWLVVGVVAAAAYAGVGLRHGALPWENPDLRRQSLVQNRANDICGEKHGAYYNKDDWDDCLAEAEAEIPGAPLSLTASRTSPEVPQASVADRQLRVDLMMRNYRASSNVRPNDDEEMQAWLDQAELEVFDIVWRLFEGESNPQYQRAILKFAKGETQFNYPPRDRYFVLRFLANNPRAFENDAPSAGQVLHRLARARDEGPFLEIVAAHQLAIATEAEIVAMGLPIYSSNRNMMGDVDIVLRARDGRRIHVTVKTNKEAFTYEQLMKEKAWAQERDAQLVGVYFDDFSLARGRPVDVANPAHVPRLQLSRDWSNVRVEDIKQFLLAVTGGR